MFKVGDEVVAIKRDDYETTKTEELYHYTEEMQYLAETQETLVVRSVAGSNITSTDWYIWHMDDLMLAVPEDLENV